MRGCACRGDSAGFVHLECLTKLAESKEASKNLQASIDAWSRCGNCKQDFQGTLWVEMDRRFWRRHRSSQDLELRYNSTKRLAYCLGKYGEVDAANQLLDEASKYVGNDKELLLDLKLNRSEMLSTNGQKLEALGLLQAMLPEAKVANPNLYGQTMDQMARVLLDLYRYQEAHQVAAENVVFVKAKFGLEDLRTLTAVSTYAVACASLFRIEEAKANLNYVLTTQTRVLGRDHPDTKITRGVMSEFGFAVPSG